MDVVVDFVKVYLLPGSTFFLLIMLTLGVSTLYAGRKAQAWARAGLAVLVVVYWALSTPLVAGWREGTLSRGYAPITEASYAEGVEAIVVLGGGSATEQASGGEIQLLGNSSALRALEAARLYRLLGDPWVIASGGLDEEASRTVPESEAMRRALVLAGVPAERILIEETSRNTHEQALALVPLLAEHGVERFILVTSPTHMRRAEAAMRAVGLDPIPAVSAQHSEALPDLFGLHPTQSALDASQVAIREILALAYYGLQGWSRAP